jgi:hypothetical protein
MHGTYSSNLTFICSLPVFICRLYTTITSTFAKSNARRLVENLIFNITLMIYYFEKLCSFYIYTITSRPFRKILWQFIDYLESVCFEYVFVRRERLIFFERCVI